MNNTLFLVLSLVIILASFGLIYYQGINIFQKTGMIFSWNNLIKSTTISILLLFSIIGITFFLGIFMAFHLTFQIKNQQKDISLFFLRTITSIPSIIWALFFLLLNQYFTFHYSIYWAFLLLTTPYFIILLFDLFRSIDLDLLSSAEALGLTPIETFYHLILPPYLPLIFSNLLFTSAKVLSEVLLFILLGFNILPIWQGLISHSSINSPISLNIYQAILNGNFAEAYIYSFILLILTTLLVLFASILIKSKNKLKAF